MRHAGSLLCDTGFCLVVACGPSSLCHAGSQAEVPGSVVVSCRPSCPTVYGILVPRPGVEPVSPALEAGFLVTGPPGNFQGPIVCCKGGGGHPGMWYCNHSRFFHPSSLGGCAGGRRGPGSCGVYTDGAVWGMMRMMECYGFC